MAASGSFTGTTSNQYILPTLVWQAQPCTEGNYSTLTAVLYYKRTNSGYTTHGTFSGGIQIGGETKTGSCSLSISDQTNVEALRATVRVTHGEDGTRQLTLSAYGSIAGTSLSSTSISQTITLDPIARASSLVCGSLTLGQDNAVTIQAADGSFRHDIYLFLGGASECLLHDRTGGGSGTIHPQRDVFGPEMPASVRALGTLRLDTYNAGWSAQVGTKNYEVELLLAPDCAPQITAVTAQMQNDNAQLRAWNVAAAGYTRLRYTITAQGISGSQIASAVFTAGGVSASGLSGTTAPLTQQGPVTLQAEVTDTRARSARQQLVSEFTVLAYTEPTLSGAAAVRCTADGLEDASGAYLKLTASAACAPLGGRNQVSLRYRSRRADGLFGSWAAFQSGAVLPGYEISRSYQVEILALDLLGNSRSILFTIPTASATVHLREGGKAVGLGKYAEEDEILDVAWDAQLRGRLFLSAQARAHLMRQLSQDGRTRESAAISSYPTLPGIYRTTSPEVAGLPESAAGYGALLLFDCGGHALHLYRDGSGYLYSAKNDIGQDGAIEKPASWQKHASTTDAVRS